MSDEIENGTRAVVDGRDCVCYEGYWVRWYEPPDESLSARKDLIVE